MIVGIIIPILLETIVRGLRTRTSARRCDYYHYYFDLLYFKPTYLPGLPTSKVPTACAAV